jgi:membrane protease YdiL (CAAX protease family)
MDIKKYIIPVFVILIITFIGYVSYIYPLACIMADKCNELFNKVAQYYFVIAIYLLVIIVLVIEKDNLETFNIDKNSLIILSLIGVVRYKLQIPFEEYYRVVCNLLSFILFVYCLGNWKKLPKTKSNWMLLGALSLVVAIPLAFGESTQVERYVESNAHFASMPAALIINTFSYTLTFVAPFEEIVWRGVFWGQLRKWNVGENRIIWLQGILFWLLHGWRIFTPIMFFISIPICTLIFSLLIKYSKQLFPSIISHTLLNTFVPIFVAIISKK